MMKVGDLFAGVGGMSQGFKMARDFEIAFAVEFDKDIAAAYKNNHKGTDVYANDIRDVDVKELHKKHPTIDVIIGGPPCQGFSQKGKRLSLDDPRNFLFQQFVRFVDEFKPKYFVLENVPTIVTTANGFFKDQIVEAFNKLGYDVTYGVLCANWGNYKFHYPNLQIKELLSKKPYMIYLSSHRVKVMKRWIMTNLQVLTIRR